LTWLALTKLSINSNPLETLVPCVHLLFDLDKNRRVSDGATLLHAKSYLFKCLLHFPNYPIGKYPSTLQGSKTSNDICGPMQISGQRTFVMMVLVLYYLPGYNFLIECGLNNGVILQSLRVISKCLMIAASTIWKFSQLFQFV